MADGVAEKSLQLPWRRLDGKVVMVTGASSGIGRDICLALARAGCNIVAAARRIDRLQSLCEEINRMGSSSDPQLSTVRSVAVELDVSAQGSLIQASVQKAWDAFGRIDALVNSAGIRGLWVFLISFSSLCFMFGRLLDYKDVRFSF